MKLNKRTMSSGIWAYVFFLILLEPAAFQHFAVTDWLYKAAHVALLAVVLLFSLGHTSRKTLKNSRVCMYMAAYYAYLLAVTWLNRGRTKPTAFQAIQFLCFALYLDIVLKYNPREIYRSALNILTVLVCANCVMVFVRPGGLYVTNYYSNNYLLGYDNQNINFILPALVLVLLKNGYYRKCKTHIILLYVAAWATAIRIWSGMTLVVTALMTAFALLCFRHRGGFIVRQVLKGRLFNLRNLLFVDLVGNVALVLLRLQYYFEYLIVYVLRRNLTLTSRTKIWDKTIEFIRQRPWFGYGREQYAERALKYGMRANSPTGLHAHNRLLETVYSGGFVMFAFFMYILFYAAGRLYRVRNTLFAKILSFGIFIYLIGMMTEYYDYCLWFWGMLVMADNAPLIVKETA